MLETTARKRNLNCSKNRNNGTVLCNWSKAVLDYKNFVGSRLHDCNFDLCPPFEKSFCIESLDVILLALVCIQVVLWKKWAYHYLYGFSILESLLRLYLPLKLETRSKMQSFIFFFFVEKSINFLELFALWLLNIYWVRLLICAWEALSTKGSRVELILAQKSP